MTETLKPLLWVLALGLSLTACKKSGTGPDADPGPDTLTNQHGKPIGELIEKTIGAQGGTISTVDENVLVSIPAGALPGDTKVSVQEVENTLELVGIGKSYRLLAQNPKSRQMVEFQQDVTITLKVSYEEVNAACTDFDYLYLGYQDDNGDWWLANNSTIDEIKKTVSVKTRHFSDWTTATIARMVIEGADEVDAGQKTTVRAITTAHSGAGKNDRIAPKDADLLQWAPWGNDRGTLVTNGSSATFTAASFIKHFEPVVISATLKDYPPRYDPRSPNRFLSATVYVRPEQYITWQVEKGIRNAAADIMFESKIDANKALTVKGRTAEASNPYNKTVAVYCKSSTAGEYPFTADYQTYVAIKYGDYYRTIYTLCNEGYEGATEGKITLTMDRGLLRGSIEGKIRNVSVSCLTADTPPIKVKFRVKPQ